jgi:hypothetical protein
VAAGVSPSLSGKIVEALPDLHLSTVSWSAGSSVKAEVSSSQLDFGVAIVVNPLLSVTTIAVEDLDGCTISEDCALDIHTLASITIMVQRATLVRRRGRWGRWGRASAVNWNVVPNLIVIAFATRPNLQLIRVSQVSVRQIETEICALENEMVIGGVGPLLSWETIKAFPNLHLNTISRVTTSIKANISAVQLDLGRSRLKLPVLCRATVTIVDLHRSSIIMRIPANIDTFLGVRAGMEIPNRRSHATSRASKGR